MNLSRKIAIGAALLGIAAAGGAVAADDSPEMNPSSPESYLLLVPTDEGAYDVYAVDEDGDGVTDGYLVIEESDTLG
ncbi:MAG TPA: hypothetical protein VKE95_17470 [Burkholderiales bacterium]|nr:hypothetical protein [Burkholderiales bacterium]